MGFCSFVGSTLLSHLCTPGLQADHPEEAAAARSARAEAGRNSFTMHSHHDSAEWSLESAWQL